MLDKEYFFSQTVYFATFFHKSREIIVKCKIYFNK